MHMDGNHARLMILGVFLCVLWRLTIVDNSVVQGEVSFIARRAIRVGGSPFSVTVGDFNGDGRQDLATSGVFILINSTPGAVVNDLVTFAPIQSTFTFTPDLTGCSVGFVGTFDFEARLTNIGERSLADLVGTVTTLTHGNLLQSADGGPGGVGA
jgi:FG-GAP-like repeat